MLMSRLLLGSPSETCVREGYAPRTTPVGSFAVIPPSQRSPIKLRRDFTNLSLPNHFFVRESRRNVHPPCDFDTWPLLLLPCPPLLFLGQFSLSRAASLFKSLVSKFLCLLQDHCSRQPLALRTPCGLALLLSPSIISVNDSSRNALVVFTSGPSVQTLSDWSSSSAASGTQVKQLPVHSSITHLASARSRSCLVIVMVASCSIG